MITNCECVALLIKYYQKHGLLDKLDISKVSKSKHADESWVTEYPDIFKGIFLNDTQRVQRAFSVYKFTKKPLWLWQKENKKEFKKSQFIKIILLIKAL